MKTNKIKVVFSIFLIFTFLAGWYFYVMNPTTPYREYMISFNQQPTANSNQPTNHNATNHNATNHPVTITDNASENIKKTPIMIEDASRDQPPYNSNMYSGFDPTSQYVGVFTNLDQIHQSTSYSELSENPMDSNWGGVLYTKNAVDSGKYNENQVVPYGYNPENGVGISTSVHNSSMKSVYA